ncbi:DUF2759 domain-containing protein [Ureibacillus sp. Re31]|uniref:DUF2759 domain-containing protein n=1 Tax=Ureibacillus galli TaxID=2762222 RepID=A0ABR8X9S0_9BACL|nr:DUF2759 domain-containing protein [Ureibacillus galli]MBD8026073.1 DUF2759 domain-containing protein [Ureibacillus galli]
MNLLMVIFALVAIFAVVNLFQAIKEKNILAFIFSIATAAIFGWFVVMTVLNQGYPPKLH